MFRQDNEFAVDAISKILHKSFPQIEVDVAKNGEIAFNKYRAAMKAHGAYLLIFMDLCMPVMDGHVATKKIREYEQSKAIARTPIFALSAPSGDSKMFI